MWETMRRLNNVVRWRGCLAKSPTLVSGSGELELGRELLHLEEEFKPIKKRGVSGLPV